MKTNLRTGRRASTGCAVYLALTACGVDATDAMSDAPLVEQHDQLTVEEFGTWTPWPRGHSTQNFPVSICFVDLDAVGEPAFTTHRNTIMSVLQETWGAASALTFTDAGVCPSNVPLGVLPVDLTTSQQGGWCGLVGPGPWGTGPHCFVSIQFVSRIRDLAVHEIGHALGVPHEHQRATGDGSTHEVALCAPQQAAWLADPTNGDLVPIPDLEKLTRFDPLSIMNYCREFNGRPFEDYTLTDVDALGIQMLYPDNFLGAAFRTLTVACDRGCFKSSDGLTVRQDGRVTLDWTARGALDLVPQWTISGGSAVTAQYLSMTATPAGSQVVVRPAYTDGLDRDFEYVEPAPAGALLRKSNERHAAIATAVL